MAISRHVLAGLTLVLVSVCKPELFDVTTVYRIDKAHEVKDVRPSQVDLLNLASWTLSEWIETDSVKAPARLSVEDHAELHTSMSSGLSEPVPFRWKFPFVVTSPSRRDPQGARYVLFMTSGEIQFGDLLMIQVSVTSVSVMSCKFLQGGISYAILNGRRCRTIETRNCTDSRQSTHYYFRVSADDLTLTSSTNEGELRVPQTYVKDVSHIAVGVYPPSRQRFSFLTPKTVFALSKPRGRLETYFKLTRPSVLCFQMTSLIQHWPGSGMSVSLWTDSTKIADIGEVSGEMGKGEWSTHQFLTRNLTSTGRRRIVIEAWNARGKWPIFIHEFHNCQLNGPWSSLTYPAPGRKELHALTNARGRRFRLHNGTVVGPVVGKNTTYSTPINNFTWPTSGWNHTVSRTVDRVLFNAPMGLTTVTSARYSKFSPLVQSAPLLKISFDVRSVSRHGTLTIYLTNSSSYVSSGAYIIAVDKHTLEAFTTENIPDTYHKECNFPRSQKRLCFNLCVNTSGTGWSNGDTVNITIEHRESYVYAEMSSTTLKGLTCQLRPQLFREGSEIFYGIETSFFRPTFHIYKEEKHALELQTEEGTVVSPPVTPPNNQLCVTLLYYMQPNTTISISAMQPGENKTIPIKSKHSTMDTGWKKETFKKNYGILNLALPVQFIIKGFRSPKARLLLQDVSICDWNEDIIEFEEQDMLTVINTGEDVDSENTSARLEGGFCHNGGVPAASMECACPPGFTGPTCEQGCGANRFGNDCSGRCSVTSNDCRAMILCRPLWGCGCAPGYTGLYCLQNCSSEHRFGADCRQQCGHCRHKPCDPYTGHCRGGCTPGYHAPLCQEECSYLKAAPQVVRSGVGANVTMNLGSSNMKGRGSPYYYQLQYKLTEGVWIQQWSDLVNSSDPVVTVRMKNPQQHTTYSIRAVIINQDGCSYQGGAVPETHVPYQCLTPGSGNYYLENTGIKSDSFSLKWQRPPATAAWCQVQHYEVFIKEDWRWTRYCTTPDTSVSVKDRSPGEKYLVKVRAVTTTGTLANFSDPLEVKLYGWPLEEVEDLTVIPVKDRMLNIIWGYPQPEPEFVKHFLVSYECIQVISCPNHPCTNSTGQKRAYGMGHTLYGLVPHAQYSINVTAYRDTYGPATDLLALTLPAGPQITVEKPKDYIFGLTESSFSVHWKNSANCSNYNGFDRGYHYRMRSADGEILEEGDTELPTATFTNITAFTNYTVDIFVLSNGGWDEEFALSVTAKTKSTRPEKVTELEVYKKGQHELRVRWGDPTQTYGQLKFFTVYHHETSLPFKTIPSQSNLVRCSDLSSLYCHNITGLKPGTQYTIAVRACNVEVDQEGVEEQIQATTETEHDGKQLHGFPKDSQFTRWCLPLNKTKGVYGTIYCSMAALMGKLYFTAVDDMDSAGSSTFATVEMH